MHQNFKQYLFGFIMTNDFVFYVFISMTNQNRLLQADYCQRRCCAIIGSARSWQSGRRVSAGGRPGPGIIRWPPAGCGCSVPVTGCRPLRWATPGPPELPRSSEPESLSHGSVTPDSGPWPGARRATPGHVGLRPGRLARRGPRPSGLTRVTLAVGARSR